MEAGKFDFKKAQRELIRKELRPILYEHGFVLCGPAAYVRERGGLLQKFYFKIEVSKLRPWVSYVPVFDARPIVEFGSDGQNGAEYEAPYRGFGWCSIGHWYTEDDAVKEKIFQRRFLPEFEALKNSIQNGLLPEMDTMRSLDDFIRLHEPRGRLFGKPIDQYDISHTYFPFISGVNEASGKKRMELILSEMSGLWLPTLPKTVRIWRRIWTGSIQTARQTGCSVSTATKCGWHISWMSDDREKCFFQWCDNADFERKSGCFWGCGDGGEAERCR